MPTDPRYLHRATDQVFTHESLDDSKFQRSWNVGAIMRVLMDMFEQGQIEPIWVQIDAGFIPCCWKDRGIEKHRLARLTPDALKVPVLFMAEPDGTHLMLDGTHRYVYAHTIGRRDILAFDVPLDVGEKARIHVPQMADFTGYKNSFSGIY